MGLKLPHMAFGSFLADFLLGYLPSRPAQAPPSKEEVATRQRLDHSKPAFVDQTRKKFIQ